MTICVLCQSEKIEETRNIDNNQVDEVELIQFYLPFYEVSGNLDKKY